MVLMRSYPDRDAWLKARKSYIGGSDAACIVGANPWKSNLRLWEEKTGRRKADDLGENKLVRYGVNAEGYLRALFQLDYPDYIVLYQDHNMWVNERYPFAHASLDGWMQDGNKRKGILEIKTATISSSAHKAQWEDQIPQNYFIQILHYFAVTEADFAILKAQLKYEIEGKEPFLQTRHYRINREDVEADVEYLMQKEEEFTRYITEDRQPPLILPEI